MTATKRFNQFNTAPGDAAPIYADPIAFHYTVHLDQVFEEKGDYRGVLNLLSEASENDGITFILNNHGGSMDIILPLINMLELTSAHTIALCTGSQSSAATIFAMYCDEIVALDFAEFMIHEAQGGYIGTLSNVVRDVKSTDRRNKRLIEEAYGGFLTPEEISDVLRGVEVYLSDIEINSRAPNRKAWREEFLIQKQQAQQELVAAAMEGSEEELEVWPDDNEVLVVPETEEKPKTVVRRKRKE